MRKVTEVKDVARFWSRVRKSPECWIWGGLKVNGYGVYSDQLAHRLAWTLTKGTIPEGMIVRHSCGVADCVKPKHLYLSTQADKMRDIRSNGRLRIAEGERHGRAKLTAEKVRQIRKLRGQGVSVRELTNKYKVSATVIYKVINGSGWKSVRDEKSENNY